MPIPKRNDLSAESVRELLDYDPPTGELRWKRTCRRPKDWNTRYAGTIAGRVSNGRVGIAIDSVRYLAHRLAWLIITGAWPKDEIDHINRNPLDNRWANLRDVNRSQNLRNRRRKPLWPAKTSAEPAQKPRDDLTAGEARRILAYDQNTGVFRWRAREDMPPKWNSRWAGKIAGAINHVTGTVRVQIGRGKFYAAHRLAWLMETGEWPRDQIDHRNGNRLDNRFENLREASCAENQRNRGLRRDNKSGHIGVSYSASRQEWEAYISVAGRRVWHDRFSTIEQAVSARREALPQFHGEFASQHR